MYISSYIELDINCSASGFGYHKLFVCTDLEFYMTALIAYGPITKTLVVKGTLQSKEVSIQSVESGLGLDVQITMLGRCWGFLPRELRGMGTSTLKHQGMD